MTTANNSNNFFSFSRKALDAIATLHYDGNTVDVEINGHEWTIELDHRYGVITYYVGMYTFQGENAAQDAANTIARQSM